MLNKYVLQADAIAYVRSQLRIGRGLARELDRLPLTRGKVMTYLPEGLPADRLRDLASGGVASGEESMVVAQLIHKHLTEAAPELRLCVFEHGLARRDDPVVSTWDLPSFTVDGDVYLFASATSTLDQILAILRKAHWYPAIGVVSHLPKNHPAVEPGAEADDELLRLLAKGARCLFIGAYDGEGWLVWFREPATDALQPIA